MSIYSSRTESFRNRAEAEKNTLMKSIENPDLAQKEVLRDLNEITKDAIYWKEMGADLSSLDNLHKSVPISAYQDFENAIARETITKGGILTNSPVIRWLKTSGTTGKPKFIPYTFHWMRKYRVPAMYAMWDTFIKASPQILLHEYSILDTQTSRENVRPSIHGLSHQSISNRYPCIDKTDWNPPWNDAEWYGANVPSDHDGKSYYRLRYFLEHDLRAITAINPSMILSLRDKLGEHHDSLVKDIGDGTLRGQHSNFTPNPATAKNLEKIFSTSNFTFKDIWPRLSFISCWASAGASSYLSRLLEQVPHATLVPFMTCGTEGVVTIPICPEQDSQPLAINQAVYEFIPVENEPESWLGKSNVDTLKPSQLEPGRKYHMIMSQAHGLLRLWTGDIFEVSELRYGTPWLRFIERYGVYHSFTGEKLTHSDVAEAFDRSFSRILGKRMPYLIAPKWSEIPYYTVAIESLDNVSAEYFSQVLDDTLCSINLEYSSKRESNRLAAPVVTVFPPDTLRRVFEKERSDKNQNQFKFKPHQKDCKLIEIIKEVAYATENV